MLTIKDFMEIVNYRITEGSDYMWDCFGHTSYRLDSWNGEQDGYTISIVFDTRTQEVYVVEAFDYKRERAYRLINPSFRDTYKQECQDRDVLDEAWEKDDGTPLMFTDLEVEEDFIEKACAIVADVDYDTGVLIPLNLEKDQLYDLMLMAHERNVTLNQLVEEVLRNEMEKIQHGF